MILLRLWIVAAGLVSLVPAHAAEPWKGTPADPELTFGAMVGIGIVGNTAGFSTVGNIAKKIVHQGFVPEINNQVFAELQLGPVLRSGADAVLYSAHLRWDFGYSEDLTLYALGGLMGYSVSGPGGDLPIAPRMGLGTFWRVMPILTLRGEVSHELIALGVSFAI